MIGEHTKHVVVVIGAILSMAAPSMVNGDFSPIPEDLNITRASDEFPRP